MNTYPEMNALILGLLRNSGAAHDLYAAARIEELQAVVIKTRSAIEVSLAGSADASVLKFALQECEKVMQ